MRKRSFWVSIFAGFILIAIAFPFLWVNGSVSADELPEVPNANLSAEGILSWGRIQGSVNALIEIQDYGKSLVVPASYESWDIKKMFDEGGLPSGTYTLKLELYGSNQKVLTKPWTTTFVYESKGKLNTPTDIVFNQSKKMITWKCEGAHEKTYYEISVRVVQNGVQVATRGYNWYTRELPLLSILAPVDGECEYRIQIRARENGYENSGYGYLNVNYTWKAEPVKNVRVDERGVLHWSAFEGANSYYIRWTYGDNETLGRYFFTDDVTEHDIEFEVINSGLTGNKISIEISATYDVDDSITLFSPNFISTSTKVSYQSTTEIYPLRIFGMSVNSRNADDILEDGGSCKYDPQTKTLTLSDPDFFEYKDYFVSPIYTSEDLTLKGSAFIQGRYTCLNVGKQLTFAPNSDITVISNADDPAVKAESIVINGKNLSIHGYNDPNGTLAASGNITFGSKVQNVVISSEKYLEDDPTYSAVLSNGGRIILNGNPIAKPEGGAVTADGRQILDKNGNPATTVIIRNSAATVPKDAIAIDEKNFPDSVFRQFILDSGLDVNMDTYLDKKEVKSATLINLLRLDLTTRDKITSLKGIELFPNLERLFFVGAKLASIDISKNTKLEVALIVAPAMKNLNISKCPFLKKAYLEGEMSQDSNVDYPAIRYDYDVGADEFQLEISDATKVIAKDPTPTPTKTPTKAPTKTPTPTKKGTPTPTKKVTKAPTKTPSKTPTKTPTKAPTKTPTKKGTPAPTKKVTKAPTKTPTKNPSKAPTKSPTKTPTKKGTPAPTKKVTKAPTKTPTKAPTKVPTKAPTKAPTKKPTGSPTPTKAPAKDPTFEDFVERLYVVALGRASEPEGKAFWVKQVVEEGKTGADCARFFLLDADEFMKRGMSVEDFVETLYATFFDRESDAAGKKGWVDAIKSGKKTRAEVVNDFIESTEWCNVCATYGVKSGAQWHKATFASKNATEFATRLFTCCLNRDPDPEGVKYWSLALTNLEQTGCSAAREFFTSKEFVGFNTTNQEYIKRLYRTFMGREPAADEVTYWTGEIKAGRQSRNSIMAFFGQSEEFTKICKQYGIDRGTI